MTAQEYLDIDKILLKDKDGNEKIYDIHNNMNISFIKFKLYPVDISTLKQLAEDVSMNKSGSNLWEISKIVCPDIFDKVYSQYGSRAVSPISEIDGSFFNVGCQQFTVQSAIELNKVL